MRWESLMIEGHEFLVRAVDVPVREASLPHICVCLLISTVTDEDSPNYGRQIQDKCHQEIDNPDQAFCIDCENNEHHLAPNQLGLGRHIHKERKNDA